MEFYKMCFVNFYSVYKNMSDVFPARIIIPDNV